MIDYKHIFRFVDQVAAKFQPAKIILFGSVAYGQPNGDSDVDLLIVMDYRGPSHHMASRIRLAAAATFPLDIIVRSETEIRDRIAANDFFLAEVMRKGVVLYAADDARMGEKGRRRLRRRLSAAQIAKAQPV